MFPVDENGIPGTMGDDRYFDGGDSAAIAGTIWALGGVTCFPEKFISTKRFVPVRHPDSTKWYGKTDRFSRDQLIPMLCCGIAAKSIALELLFLAHRRRWFLTSWNTKQNHVMDGPSKFPDICGPEIWALWIRYKWPNAWWARVILNFLDIQTLLGAIQWRLFPPSQLTRNHMLVSLAIRDTAPTLLGWLVNKINDWTDLIAMWKEHCYRSYEYDTSELFTAVLLKLEARVLIEEQVFKTRTD